MKKRILFVCIGNSGRSQMAEAFFERISGGRSGMSAGIKPDKKMHPLTIETMEEVGINVGRRRPKRLTNEMLKEAVRIVVMDAHVRKQIPSRCLSKTENWNIKSLLGKNNVQVRRIRDEIRRKVERLSEELEACE